MKAHVKRLDGRAFVGESGSGHAVVMDGAPEAGGRNIGVRYQERSHYREMEVGEGHL